MKPTIVGLLVVTSCLAADTLLDKDRADFLLAQRDWMAVQTQYEAQFRKEPAVLKFEIALEKMKKACTTTGTTFDMQTVSCVKPKEEKVQDKK